MPFNALAVLFAALAGFVIGGVWYGPGQPISFGMMAGCAAGVGWVATALGILYLFEARPLAHWLVNAGYCIVTFVVMGGILAALG